VLLFRLLDWTDSSASGEKLPVWVCAKSDLVRDPWLWVNSAVAPQAIEASSSAASTRMNLSALNEKT